MSNERLRSCISMAGMEIEEIAEEIGVDPKTVARWISTERVPHKRHRWKMSKIVNRDETYLWPSLMTDSLIQEASKAEFVQLYPSRGAVPREKWRDIVDNAKSSIDFLVYSGIFISDSHPALMDALTAAAERGVRVRILFGDPESTTVLERGIEEGVGNGLANRIKIGLRRFSPILGTRGIEVRLHDTILYNSIYRGDTTMLLNLHAYGGGAPFNPVLHLQRVAGGRMFDHYQSSFERVWELGKEFKPKK